MCESSLHLNERYHEWLLKNPIFSKNHPNRGIENVHQNRESRL
jgi:hypothetical protein